MMIPKVIPLMMSAQKPGVVLNIASIQGVQSQEVYLQSLADNQLTEHRESLLMQQPRELCCH